MKHLHKIRLEAQATPAILLAIFMTISFLVGAGQAFSQSGFDPSCYTWSAFPDGNKRKLRLLQDLQRPTDISGWIPDDASDKPVEGTFKFDGPDGADVQRIAVWDDSEYRFAFTTTQEGKTVRFVPDDRKRKPSSVSFGWLPLPPSRNTGRQLIVKPPPYCVTIKDHDAKGREIFVLAQTRPDVVVEGKDSDGVVIKGGIKPPPIIAGKPPPSIGSTLKKLSVDPPDEDELEPAPPSITEIMKKKAAEGEKTDKTAATGKDPTAPEGGDDKGDPTKKKASKIEDLIKAGETPPGICSWNDLAEIPKPINTTELPDTFAIGTRNKEKMAQAYDFIRVSGGDLVIRDFMIDLGASTTKSMAFEPVAPPSTLAIDGKNSDVLPVSVSGADTLPREQIFKEGAEPAATLNIVVVGAAEEVAISGLGDVGKSLRKQSRGRIGVKVEWHIVDSAGHLGKAVNFKSLQELVEAAAAQAKGESFIVLGTDQFISFLDEFQRTLTQESERVDRVFWVKGAYRLPSVAPKHIEDFLTAMADAPVIPRRPNGEAEQWLTIVTARIPGFSVAYLKEPVSALNAGDVIDEPADQTEPRRLIVDPSPVATGLNSLGQLRASKPIEGTTAKPDATISDLLVLDAYEVFGERGYALSSTALTALGERLAELAEVWKRGSLEEVLQLLTTKTDKPSPSISDFLESSPLEGLRLRFLVPWARTGFADLSEEDIAAAKKFVLKLDQSISKIEKQVAAQRNDACGFVYIPNADLGFN